MGALRRKGINHADGPSQCWHPGITLMR